MVIAKQEDTVMTKMVSRSGHSAGAGTVLAPEERQRMIAEAAYFRALQRGFGGDPVADWLVAEREIDERLLPSPRRMKQLAAPVLPARAPGRAAAPRP
jgi:hypothetical protein